MAITKRISALAQPEKLHQNNYIFMSKSKNTTLLATGALLVAAFAIPAAAELASDIDISDISENVDEKVNEITDALGEVLRPQYEDPQP